MNDGQEKQSVPFPAAVSPPPQQPIVCHECGKPFISAKALGGHMRIHSKESPQERVKLKLKTKMMVNLNSILSDHHQARVGNTEKTQLNPCPHCGKEFPSNKSLYGHLSWHSVVDRKRGRQIDLELGKCNAIESSSSNSSVEKHDQEEEERINDAVQGLLMLANSFISKDQSDGFSPKIPSKLVQPLTDDDDLHVKKKMKQTNEEMYKCSICQKSYPSHQALGGHKSSHFKGNNQTEIIKKEITEEGSYSAVQPVHQCKQCDKSFKSGQALGGHMRAHWKIAHEFDLNELPPQIDDQENEKGLD